ncbi:MAG: hypothetical protein KAW13_02555 [Dehalococcoidia bacterium]|nr:hypothetical protein [Dehalococcoidia bacterium]
MVDFQSATKAKLKNLLEERNYWLKMHSGKLLEVEQSQVPAKKSPGGTSRIISYYDEHLQYVCTIHIITSKTGKVIHEHVKDAHISGIRYKIK